MSKAIKGLGVGRIVHFQVSKDRIRPAIVTRVIDREEGKVGLCLFADPNDPPGLPYDATMNTFGVAVYDGNEEPRPMTWHWPPRVD